jgi:hypothetical protein
MSMADLAQPERSAKMNMTASALRSGAVRIHIIFSDTTSLQSTVLSRIEITTF